MAAKKSMPPELLAHFKKKQGDEDSNASKEDVKKGDKERRKEAVNKARVRLEESKRRKKANEKEKAGKAGS